MLKKGSEEMGLGEDERSKRWTRESGGVVEIA